MSALRNVMDPVRAWLARLSARERRIVVWGGIGSAVAVFFGLILLPLYSSAAKARQRVEQKQEDLSWMRSVAGELRAAGPVGPAPVGATGSSPGSLIVLVDQSAQRTGLGPAVTGSQPSGNGGIRVRVEGAAFDALVGWLAMLEQQHGVAVESASVDRTDKVGQVNASVVLRKAG